MILKRLIILFLIQIAILLGGPFYIAISSTENSAQSSSCGSGAGSCGSVAVNQATNGESDQTTNLDAGFPIDIPAPIAKATSGINPSSLEFSSSSTNLNLISNRKNLSDLKYGNLTSPIGTLTGEVIGAGSLSSEKNIAVIIEGEFRETVTTTNNGNFQITIDETDLNIPIGLAVFSDNSTSSNGGTISPPVFAVINTDPDGNYYLEIMISNVDADTTTNGGNIQNLPLSFSNDGALIIFQAIDQNDVVSLYSLAKTGGLHELLSEDTLLMNLFDSTTDDATNQLLGIQQSTNDLCFLASEFSCFDEGLDLGVTRGFALSPNKTYLAIQSSIDNDINIYHREDLNTPLGTIITPGSEELADKIELVWLSNTALAMIKNINNTYELQKVDDLSGILNQTTNETDPLSMSISDTELTNPQSLNNDDQTLFLRCDDGSGNFEICEVNLNDGLSVISTYYSDTNSILNLELTLDKDFLIFETEVPNDTNIISAFSSNTDDEDAIFLAYGALPETSNTDNNLVAYLKDEQIYLINLENFDLDFTLRNEQNNGSGDNGNNNSGNDGDDQENDQGDSQEDDQAGNSDPPLLLSPTITSTTPGNNATNIGLDSIISLEFDLDMNESITEDAFSFFTLDQTYQGSFEWDNTSTSFDFTPTINLIPNTNYLIQLSTEAESADGGNLENQSQTSFTTRDFRSTIAVTGDFALGEWINQSGHGSMAVNPNNDSVHVVYIETNEVTPYYTSCAGDCNDNDNWSMPQEIYDNGNDMNLSDLRIDSNNKLHFVINEFGGLTYLTCSNNCSNSANWTALDLSVSISNGEISLYIDSNDDLHISYVDNNFDLYYYYCDDNCSVLGSWDNTKVYDTNELRLTSSIKKLPNNSIGIAFVDDDNNKAMYASCSANCTDSNNWATTVVDNAEVSASIELANDNNNAVYITYVDDSTFNVRLASCSSSCADNNNWTSLALTNTGNYSPSTKPQILANSSGVIMVFNSLINGFNGELNFLVCENGCDNLANWNIQTVYDGIGNSGQYPKARLGVNDKLHIVSFDEEGVGDGVPDIVYSD